VKRVLIVEDERDLLDSLQEFFEDEGFTVQTATNGAEALSLLDADELPSVVLLDLTMPVLDGNELYARMRAEPRLAGIPVIVSTSDPSRAPSGVLIMKKPVNLGSLLGAVQSHCQAG
jgi:two-component system, sensor histidine kinase and response regulator